MIFNNKFDVAFVRQDDRKYEEKYEKIIKKIRKIFIKIKIEETEKGINIIIPKYGENNKNTVFINKIISKKLNYLLKKINVNCYIIDDKLKYMDNIFQSDNFFNKKILMKMLINELIEFVFEVSKQNTNLENIYIFVHEYSKNNIDLINMLVMKFKTVNIITDNLKYYKRLENKLYNQGILITVSNNKRKSLKNSKYIINMDFSNEEIGQYNINQKSIIINLVNENLALGKMFNGIIINNFQIDIDEDMKEYVKEFYGKINYKNYIEACLCCGENVEYLRKQYNIKIVELIGVRGVLNKCEFLV